MHQLGKYDSLIFFLLTGGSVCGSHGVLHSPIHPQGVREGKVGGQRVSLKHHLSLYTSRNS